RDLACETLFPGTEPRAAARALSKALSMARAALAELGEPAASVLQADPPPRCCSPPATPLPPAEGQHPGRPAGNRSRHGRGTIGAGATRADRLPSRGPGQRYLLP
ncbi:MAG TPA: hypothetical protein VI365_17195, partial [Trebonia sp.]